MTALDVGRLFVGGFAQWLMTTLLTRSVMAGNPLAVFGATFAIQTVWWVNIQHTVKSNQWPRWLAWSLGAAAGAATGMVL